MMPRFYFHLRDEVDAPDIEGRDLPDVDAARRAAAREAREMAAASVREGRLNLSEHIRVTDAEGVFLFDIAFGQVVTLTNPSAR